MQSFMPVIFKYNLNDQIQKYVYIFKSVTLITSISIYIFLYNL